MDEQAHESDHHQHHYCQGVDENAYVKFGEPQPRLLDKTVRIYLKKYTE